MSNGSSSSPFDQIAQFQISQFVDDRGDLLFCNELPLGGIVRFYTVRNYMPTIRAWHGHRRENKLIMALSGAAKLVIVPLDELESYASPVQHRDFVLHPTGSVVKVPAGCAHGFRTIVPDTQLLVFSDSSLEQSRNDDVRFGAERLRDLFDILER